MKKKNDRIILIDADVLSHFITGGLILYLHKVFRYPIYIVDQVYEEITVFSAKKKAVDTIINQGFITQMPFPDNDPVIRKEFAHIRKLQLRGKGEAAIMAIAHFNGEIVASSNLKDIKSYCDMHSISFLTTMDFLYVGWAKGIFTETQCDQFITSVLQAGSKLPVKTFQEFKENSRDLDFMERDPEPSA